VKTEAGRGAAGGVKALFGGVSDKILLGDILPKTFTLCSLTRYTGSTKGRILIGGGRRNEQLAAWAMERSPRRRALQRLDDER